LNLCLHHIAPQLQSYIKAISSVENPAGALPVSFRVLPDTCVEIFFGYNDATIAAIDGKTKFNTAKSFVNSRMSSFIDVQLPPGSGSIAVCFKPGAAFPFFNLSMKELSDNSTLLCDVWGAQINEVEDRITASNTNEERVSVIQNFLLAFLQKEPTASNDYEYCLWQIHLLKGRVPLKTLSQKTNISSRQLSRQFHTYLGLSPKEFARVTRFIHSLENIKKFRSYSLTEIAYESGYFDQSHFIHDCKEFSGMTPGELLHSHAILY